jgi:hypothetical protein
MRILQAFHIMNNILADFEVLFFFLVGQVLVLEIFSGEVVQGLRCQQEAD